MYLCLVQSVGNTHSVATAKGLHSCIFANCCYVIACLFLTPTTFLVVFFTQRSILERAVEEQPTEIFVKHEIPFDLELVGTLLEEIRGSLVGGSTPTQQRSLPELRVTKMDDITSCLAVLRDYVASVSCNFAGKRDAFQLELKHSREQITDLELQLQETILESESSEGGLLTQLQVSCQGIHMNPVNF